MELDDSHVIEWIEDEIKKISPKKAIYKSQERKSNFIVPKDDSGVLD